MYAPWPHEVQTRDVTAPGVELYVPAAQEVHPEVDVVSSLYVPAAQAAHAGNTVYVPTPHEEQTAGVDAPRTEEKRPAAQAVQPDVPVDSVEYVPTAHDVQPDVPVVSAL